MTNEYEKLQKEIKQLQEVKNNLDIKIKTLSDEEIRYLNEIPSFKKQADEGRLILNKLTENIALLKKDLSNITNEIKSGNEILQHAQENMKALRINSETILAGIRKDREDVNNKVAELKKREAALVDREQMVTQREDIVTERESKHAFNVTQTSKAQIDIYTKSENLQKSVDAHALIVIAHDEAVTSLNKRAKAYADEEELLKNKMIEAQRIIKNNEDLKISLSEKNDELIKQIDKYKKLQESLIKNINDLDSKEKSLKILELRIKKLAHEAGLDKELKELEESIK